MAGSLPLVTDLAEQYKPAFNVRVGFGRKAGAEISGEVDVCQKLVFFASDNRHKNFPDDTTVKVDLWQDMISTQSRF